MTGLPWLGASARRMLRGITVRYTLSPKCSRTSSAMKSATQTIASAERATSFATATSTFSLARTAAHAYHAITNPKDSTEQMDLGNTLHLAVLEPESKLRAGTARS